MEEVFCEKLISPLVVFWEITSRCNLLCRHCYTHSGRSGVELSREKLFEILRILCSKNIFSLGIGGGEPLLVKELESIIKNATESDVDISLSTNGTLLTPSRAKRLKEAGVVLVQVSIDGLESTHDSIRGKGNFKKAVKALRILKDHNIVTRLAFTANKQNYSEIEPVFELALGLEIDWFIVFRYMDSGREGKSLVLSKEQLKQIATTLIKLHQNFPLKVFFEKLLFLPFLLDERYVSKKLCNAGKSIMNICANGDVTPCPHIRNIIVGNILQDDFNELWHSPLMDGNGKLSRECSRCKFNESCGGGCLATTEDGLTNKDPLCWVDFRK